MKNFKAEDELSWIIQQNYLLLPVINRFGLGLGFGDKKVHEICDETGISSGFFLAIINTYHNPDYFPEEALLSFSPLLIIDYLQNTHIYYLDYSIPRIENLLNILLEDCSEHCTDLNIIESFYKKYKEELLIHIRNEEEEVFPYVRNLYKFAENDGKNQDPYMEYSIRQFEKEHTNVDEKLNDLKNLILKYLKPDYDQNHCNEFLFALFQFEQDLKDHARIEDKILVSKVLEIEKQINNG
jgi:regulator of cell morphogenesis and NO signaling